MEKDISQKLNCRTCLDAAITSNTTTNGAAVDTQGIQTGLMFSIAALLFTDGVYAVSFEQADDLAFTTNVNTVAADQIVGSIEDIIAAAVNGAVMGKAGILSLKDPAVGNQLQRFVRPVITSTGVTTGATLAAIATEMLDEAP